MLLFKNSNFLRNLTLCFGSLVFMLSQLSAQIATFTEDFSGDSLDGWSTFGTGGTHDTTNDVYTFEAIQGSQSPYLNRSGSGPVTTMSDYTATISFDMINFKGGGAAGASADFRMHTNGEDGRIEFKINPWGNVNITHSDYRTSGGWTITNLAGDNTLSVGTSNIQNGSSLTIQQKYTVSTDSFEWSYAFNDDALTSLYTNSVGATGTDGFGDTITGISFQSNAKMVEISYGQWSSVSPAAEIDITSFSVVVPEPNTYALIAGMLVLSSVVLRRRK